MRIFDFKDVKWDFKYLIISGIAVLLAIISGIVLYKLSNINIYFASYSNKYIFYVFNFKNTSLFFSRFLSELFYFYALFLIVYFTKLKYLSLIFFFIKTLFVAVYSIILCAVGGFGGVLIVIIIFIPTYLISIAAYLIMIETCKLINKKYVFFIPLILALVVSVVMLILINLLFRVVIIIV